MSSASRQQYSFQYRNQFQYYKSSASGVHRRHIHFVWAAVLRAGGNHLDELFVEKVWRQIEVGVRNSHRHRLDHM